MKLLAATGSSCRVLRLWRDGNPYFCRSQVANTLTTTSDKRLRAAGGKALAEEDEVSTQTCCCTNFAAPEQRRRVHACTRVLLTQLGAVVDATASEVAFLKACKLVGSKTNMQSSVQVRKSGAKHADVL